MVRNDLQPHEYMVVPTSRYSALDESSPDWLVDRAVEAARVDFYNAWLAYIREYDDFC